MTLPSLANCTFDRCSFDKVTIRPGANRISSLAQHRRRISQDVERAYIKNTTFSDCKDVDLEIIGTEVENIAFSDCAFRSISFTDCLFSKNLILLRGSRIDNIKIDTSCEHADDYREMIEDGGRISSYNVLKWTLIKFLRRLPIPKVGFSILAVVMLLLPVYNAFIFWACRGAEGCSVFNWEISYWEIDNDIFWSFFALLALISTSILHSIMEPPIVTQYSRVQWYQEFRQSVLQYDHVNRSKKFFVFLLMFLYIVSIGYLFFVYASRAFPYY